MLPKLPAALGGGSGKRITAGIQWLAASIAFDPKASVKIVIQSQSPDAAKYVQNLIPSFLKMVGNDSVEEGKTLAEFLGADFDRIVKALTPEIHGDRLALQLDDELLFDFGAKIVLRLQEAAGRAEHVNNLKMIVLGMHNYLDSHGAFPARAGYGLKEAKFVKDKRPLLSWRVFMLPYIEQDNLYQQFHLDEPWDSEHNKKLIAMIPPVFRSANEKLSAEGKTRIVAPVGKDMAFEPNGEGTKINDFTDGTSNTILLLEAAEDRAVVWTKPDDLEIDVNEPKTGVFDPDAKSFLAALADGSVRTIPKKIESKMLLYLFLRNDGNPVQIP